MISSSPITALDLRYPFNLKQFHFSNETADPCADNFSY